MKKATSNQYRTFKSHHSFLFNKTGFRFLISFSVLLTIVSGMFSNDRISLSYYLTPNQEVKKTMIYLNTEKKDTEVYWVSEKKDGTYSFWIKGREKDSFDKVFLLNAKKNLYMDDGLLFMRDGKIYISLLHYDLFGPYQKADPSLFYSRNEQIFGIRVTKTNGEYILFNDGTETGPFNKIKDVLIQEKEDGIRWLIISETNEMIQINDSQSNQYPLFTHLISEPVFNKQGTQVIFSAVNDDGYYFYSGNTKFGPYQKPSETDRIFFTENGSNTAYSVLVGGETFIYFKEGSPAGPYQNLNSLLVDHQGHWTVVYKEDGRYYYYDEKTDQKFGPYYNIWDIHQTGSAWDFKAEKDGELYYISQHGEFGPYKRIYDSAVCEDGSKSVVQIRNQSGDYLLIFSDGSTKTVAAKWNSFFFSPDGSRWAVHISKRIIFSDGNEIETGDHQIDDIVFHRDPDKYYIVFKKEKGYSVINYEGKQYNFNSFPKLFYFGDEWLLWDDQSLKQVFYESSGEIKEVGDVRLDTMRKRLYYIEKGKNRTYLKFRYY